MTPAALHGIPATGKAGYYRYPPTPGVPKSAPPPSPAPHTKPSKGKPINMPRETEHDDTPESTAPEDRPGEPGAEGGSHSDAKDKLPGAPSDDDSDVGDTDQHSSA